MREFFREYKTVIKVIFGVLVMIAGVVLIILRQTLPGFLVFLIGMLLLLLSTNGYTDKNIVLGKGNRIARRPDTPSTQATAENSPDIWEQMAVEDQRKEKS